MSMAGCVVHRSKLCGMRQLWGELRGSNTGRTCVLVSVGPVRAMYVCELWSCVPSESLPLAGGGSYLMPYMAQPR